MLPTLHVLKIMTLEAAKFGFEKKICKTKMIYEINSSK